MDLLLQSLTGAGGVSVIKMTESSAADDNDEPVTGSFSLSWAQLMDLTRCCLTPLSFLNIR